MGQAVKEILVQFDFGLEPGARERILRDFGCALKEEILPQRIVVVDLPAGKDLGDLVRRLREADGVAYAEPNGEVEVLEGGA